VHLFGGQRSVAHIIGLTLRILIGELSMNDALKDWLNDVFNELRNLDISVTISDGYKPKSYNVNMDSNKFVGTICFWPDDIFEFQFNDCKTGDIILLDTVSFNSPSQLRDYLDKLIFEKLIRKVVPL